MFGGQQRASMFGSLPSTLTLTLTLPLTLTASLTGGARGERPRERERSSAAAEALQVQVQRVPAQARIGPRDPMAGPSCSRPRVSSDSLVRLSLSFRTVCV